MINVSIAGIGGQGSVLAARILSQAAADKGWRVVSSETVGMAQRGGNVVSHVRIGNKDEEVFSPVPAKGTVDILIALEPGEAARNIDYLKRDGLLVTARSGITPLKASFNRELYDPQKLLDDLRENGIKMVEVDDEELMLRAKEPQTLNVMLLAYAVLAVNKRPDCAENAMRGAFEVDDIDAALSSCMKRKQVSTNQKALKVVQQVARF